MKQTILRRNLGMDLVRVTETTALTAAQWLGRGDSEAADQVATQAMYEALNSLSMQGRIVIGEEDKVGLHSPLDTGKMAGDGQGPKMDVVVDPLDGARLLMYGRSGALSAAAVTVRGAMWNPKPAIYMEKFIVDREVAGGLVTECLDAPVAWTLALVARLKKKPIEDLVVFMLERPRHQEMVEEIRSAGARVWLRADGDISGAILAATPDSGVDVLVGIGGVTEGTIAACAVKSLGGGMLGRFSPQSAQEKEQVKVAGLDLDHIFTQDEIIKNEEIYLAVTGITDGTLMRGIKYRGDRAETNSIILRGESGTRRIVYAEHLIGYA